MANKKITSEEVFDPNLFATVIKAAAALRKVLEENLTTLKDISKTQAFNSGEDIKKYNDVVSQTTTNVKAFEMAQKDADEQTKKLNTQLAEEVAASEKLKDILNDVNGTLESNIKLQVKRKNQIKAINEEQAKLNARFKAGRISAEAYNNAATKLTQKTTELKVANSNLLFTIKAQIKEGQAAETSFEQQAQRLGQLRKAYRSLSKEQRENAEVGGTLLKSITVLDKQVKANDASIGNFQRSVGNYGKAIGSAVKETGAFSVVINTVAQAQGALAATQKAVTIATGTSTGALRLFKIALISTGIGAIVVALGSMVTALTATEEGTEKLNKGLKAVGVVVGNVIDVYIEAGKVLINFYTTIGKVAVKALSGDFKGAIDIAQKAINDFDVTGVTEAFDDLINKTGTEIEQQNKLSDLRAENLKLARELTVETARGEKEIADLRLKARDFDKFTAAERLKFLEQAIAKENELLTLEVDLATRRNKIAQEELSFSQSTTAELDAAAEAEAELFKVQTKRLTRSKELQSEINRAKKENEKTTNFTLDDTEDDEFDVFNDPAIQQQLEIDAEKRKLREKEEKEVEDVLARMVKANEKAQEQILKDEEEAAKEREELRKQQVQQVENVAQGVFEARDRVDNQEQEKLERKAERTTQNIEIQAQLAAQGLDNTLAESQKKQAEIELEQQELAEKQEKRQKRQVFYESVLSALKEGGNPIEAVGKALAAQAAVNLIAGSFYEGTDRVGDDAKANLKGNGKDNTLVALTQEERVIGHKDSLRVRNKLGNISNKDLVDLALNNQGGVSVASMNDRNIVSGLEKVTTAVEGIQFHLNIDPNGNISKEEHRRGLKKVLRAAKRRPRLND